MWKRADDNCSVDNILGEIYGREEGMKLTDEQRKVLTDLIGECWHELINDADFPMQCSCGKGISTHDHHNRPFTTHQDLVDVYGKLVEKGEWEGFVNWLVDNEILGDLDDREYRLLSAEDSAWLHCLAHPEQIPERMRMVAEWREERKGEKG